jgi:hypothetical protein
MNNETPAHALAAIYAADAEQKRRWYSPAGDAYNAVRPCSQSRRPCQAPAIAAPTYSAATYHVMAVDESMLRFVVRHSTLQRVRRRCDSHNKVATRSLKISSKRGFAETGAKSSRSAHALCVRDRPVVSGV